MHMVVWPDVDFNRRSAAVVHQTITDGRVYVARMRGKCGDIRACTNVKTGLSV